MNNLKKIRTLKGMTQQQLAEKVDCKSQYISDIERGIRNINSIQWGTLDKICKALDCTIYDLINEQPENLTKKEKLEKILNKYDITFDELQKLNEYQIKALEAEFHDIYNENISISFYF